MMSMSDSSEGRARSLVTGDRYLIELHWGLLLRPARSAAPWTALDFVPIPSSDALATQ